MASVEEQVEHYYKNAFEGLGLRLYGKTETINDAIKSALEIAESKSGGNGNNYPDIKFLIEDNHRRVIPVMVEAKGSAGKLEKLDKSGNIVGVTEYKTDTKTHSKGDANYSTIQTFAINGAMHYANAILKNSDYDEVIFIGINGSELDSEGVVKDPELKGYYLSVRNSYVPKHIKEFDVSLDLLKPSNVDALYAVLDDLCLSDAEREEIKIKAESELESKVKDIHQRLYDDPIFKNALGTNEKLYLFCGLIMAGLKADGVAPLEVSDLKGNISRDKNDGTEILDQIRVFLRDKKCSNSKLRMIMGMFEPVFLSEKMWKPVGGESLLKSVFRQIKSDVIPCLENPLHLDFAGKILNSLNDWVSLSNDEKNDVVLTPRYVTTLMAKLARTDMNSFVWDNAMGSAGFLVSAMDIMVSDAIKNIQDADELEKKIRHIKEQQLLGVEILGNVYILAVLNMILMGDGSSNIFNGDNRDSNYQLNELGFPANVYLLNPPYSASGKGFCFVEDALKSMTHGYAAILIQDSAGNGQGLPYTKNILKDNTLEASIKMPSGLFGNKASVSVYIFVFKVGRAHEEDDLVTFIDFSEDGYARQNRKKSNQEVNLRNVDHADERYSEIEAIVLGKKPKTNFYTEENGKVIRDSITLYGDDWLFTQHQVVDLCPTEDDFKNVVANYLSFKVDQLLKGVE